MDYVNESTSSLDYVFIILSLVFIGIIIISGFIAILIRRYRKSSNNKGDIEFTEDLYKEEPVQQTSRPRQQTFQPIQQTSYPIFVQSNMPPYPIFFNAPMQNTMLPNNTFIQAPMMPNNTFIQTPMMMPQSTLFYPQNQ